VKILGVAGSPLSPSRTLALVKKATEYAGAANVGAEIETTVINLCDLDVQFCDGRDPSAYDGDTDYLINQVCQCDALILGTPMYRASYTARLKNMFDLIPNDALRGKPVGIIATGGSDHHFLAIEHQLKPIIGFFHGIAIPGAVYANNSHFGDDGELADQGIIDRLKQMCDSLTNLTFSISATGIDPAGAEAPEIKRK
jgi:MsuE subfamily FMN reductase